MMQKIRLLRRSLENAVTAEPRETKLEAKAPAHTVAHHAADIKLLGRSSHARGDRVRPGRRHPILRKIGLDGACGALLLAGHVDASVAIVASEVLPEIRELQRR